jgi:PAS domain S-box-containing protein/putative nucleotidyltransferase with HDIG domain
MMDPDVKSSGQENETPPSHDGNAGAPHASEEMWRRYEFIANTSKDFMTLISADYRYEAVNKAYCQAHDKPQEKIVGRKVAEVWGEDRFRAHVKPPLDRCLAGNEVGYRNWFEFSKLGVRFIDVAYYPYYDENGTVTHAVVISRDATDFQLTQEKTQRQLQRLNALHNIDMAVTTMLDLGVILKVLLNQATSQLGIDAADVLLFDPNKETLEYAEGLGLRGSDFPASPLRLGEGLAGRAALERRVVVVPDFDGSTPEIGQVPLLEQERFVTYYGVPLIAGGKLKGVLELFNRGPLDPDPEWLSFLRTLGGQAAIAIDNANLFEELQLANMELVEAYDVTLEGWVRTLDMRDNETEGHTQRVTELTVRLARVMGVDEVDLEHVRRGALLHDIGKMAVPDNILRKPGPLTDEEWEVMRRHPVYAYDLLSPITFLRPALDIPYCHHERWNGAGYPRGLAEDRIPLTARIFAVVDVWDALCSYRPYRPAWPPERVRAYLREESGSEFDPSVVQAFLHLDIHPSD